MILFDAIKKALGELTDPALRSLLWKAIGLTILGLIFVWFGLRAVFEATAVTFLSGWFSGLSLPYLSDWGDGIGMFTLIAASIAFAVLLAFLIGPVSAAIAGVFLDDVAEHVEQQDYPQDAPGRALPLGQSLWLSVKFFAIVILGNLIALALLLIPGINLIAFFLVNGFLLGREYFMFAAMRFRSEKEALALRSRYSSTVLFAGFAIAGFMSIPILNLATPLFGAALMVHIHKALSREAETTYGSAIR
ncbi:MAG: sulfate transporter family protein [Pseudomonadota bacterium]